MYFVKSTYFSFLNSHILALQSLLFSFHFLCLDVLTTFWYYAVIMLHYTLSFLFFLSSCSCRSLTLVTSSLTSPLAHSVYFFACIFASIIIMFLFLSAYTYHFLQPFVSLYNKRPCSIFNFFFPQSFFKLHRSLSTISPTLSVFVLNYSPLLYLCVWD